MQSAESRFGAPLNYGDLGTLCPGPWFTTNGQLQAWHPLIDIRVNLMTGRIVANHAEVFWRQIFPALYNHHQSAFLLQSDQFPSFPIIQVSFYRCGVLVGRAEALRRAMLVPMEISDKPYTMPIPCSGLSSSSLARRRLSIRSVAG